MNLFYPIPHSRREKIEKIFSKDNKIGDEAHTELLTMDDRKECEREKIDVEKRGKYSAQKRKFN